MPETLRSTLGLTRALLRLCRGANIAAAAAFFLLLGLSFVREDLFVQYYRTHMPGVDVQRLLPALRAMVLVGAPMFALVHALLTRLLAMAETVRDGDPFVPENAERLRAVAWCLLMIQLLHMGFGVLAAQVRASGAPMEWEFPLAGWLAVLLTFVLAGVFREGARLRGDLQAMI
ncbi:DUF2975 domain-containing protein [Phenylobacterium sp.]|jgi:hypothetical protein|uniref:DUF2975 domain-containing protein n=1 Tax=Phenylobacterium sp. TaxID=1871053 RepID=UPI002F922E47